MKLAQIRLWFLVLAGVVLAPRARILAQQATRSPGARTPRVVLTEALDGSSSRLTHLIMTVADERVPRTIDPHRLYLVPHRDLVATLQTGTSITLLEEYRELALLLRADVTVVLDARGRPDSLEMIGSIVPTQRLPIDTMRFHASSPRMAVDSIVARLLADPRVRRGTT